MQMTDTHFIISVPRFAGYKTLFVNAVIILFGVVTVVYPTFVSPDPGTVGAFYDTATGFVAMIIGLINVVLRLVTTSPSAPFKPASDASGGGFSEAPGQLSHILEARTKATAMELSEALNFAPGPTVRAYPLVVPTRVPVFDAVDRVSHAQIKRSDYELTRCTPGDTMLVHPTLKPKWSQYMSSPDTLTRRTPGDVMRTDNISVADAIALDAVATDLAEMGLGNQKMEAPRSGLSALRAFAIALVLPSLMLASAAGVASLGGCATAREVNAIVSAESVEQRAFALYGTFTVLEERAAELVQDRRIPKSARLNIQRVDRVAKPLADKVRELAVKLNAARLAFSTAQGGSEKVATAVEALQAALVAFQPALSAMTTAVNTARA